MLAWYRLASHLHLPLQECKAKTTSSEFVAWQEYLLLENTFERTEYYYLASIAAEIRRSYVKYPRRVKLKDFILKFKSKPEHQMKPLSEEEKKGRIKMSKSFWFGALGLKRKK